MASNPGDSGVRFFPFSLFKLGPFSIANESDHGSEVDAIPRDPIVIEPSSPPKDSPELDATENVDSSDDTASGVL